jgi:hypothetical protein
MKKKHLWAIVFVAVCYFAYQGWSVASSIKTDGTVLCSQERAELGLCGN